jgi:drug/metabolite transporter (DMT)-like permease
MRSAVQRQFPSLGVFIGCAIISAFVVPWLPMPARESWPYLAGSLVTHVVYCFALARAYRTGDFSRSYPLMRGLPPLFTGLLVAAFAGESMTTPQLGAMLVLCVGILSLVFEPGTGFPPRKLALGWSLLVAAMIAVYTAMDGIGVRLSGNAASYAAWLMLLEGSSLAVLLAATQGRAPIVAILRSWKLTLIGGLSSAIGYALVIWAMTRAPIALVAAARETSVVFAALIGVVAFKERLTAARIASILLVVAGLVGMRLA